ncbi:DUF1579 domain-containing protein [Thalassotalea euphylliae]|uniref:DUF1579 domain-containing protein n=1 Tax=Thalassotalea euphylliae TaxID=1655234 RepID=A0A3E0UND3_9GAMM|nr:DUF1579 domain-containing protein [Thalassotalea euphylliae]REL37182.1 DUF1579 domain-containing protein [Thalassotalea euphylliae]
MTSKVIILLIALTAFASSACDDKSHRQFDFWIGHWQVTNSANDEVSNSKVSLINNGCGILEEYRTPSGFEGKSLNIYDQLSKRWHQTWIDNTGLLLQLDGEFKGNIMTLTGELIVPHNPPVMNKITWQRFSEEVVVQRWYTSQDNGKTWELVFDGYYERVKPDN